jgi:hypothetical protein
MLNAIVDLGMLFRRGGGKARNVFGPVATRRQKIRKHNNLRRATSHTTIEGLRNRGFGEFHMSRLDNRKLRLRGKASCRFVQHLVAFTTPRSMIDNNNANNCGHSDLKHSRQSGQSTIPPFFSLNTSMKDTGYAADVD